MASAPIKLVNLDDIISGVEFCPTQDYSKVIRYHVKRRGKLKIRAQETTKSTVDENYCDFESFLKVLPDHLISCIRNNEFVIEPETGLSLTGVTNLLFDSRSRHEYLSYGLRTLLRCLHTKTDVTGLGRYKEFGSTAITLPLDLTDRVLDLVLLLLTDMVGNQMDAALLDASGGEDETKFEAAINDTLFRVDCIGAALELIHEATGPRPDVRDTAYLNETFELTVANILRYSHCDELIDAMYDSLALVMRLVEHVIGFEKELAETTLCKDWIGRYSSHIAARVTRGADILNDLSSSPLFYNAILQQRASGSAVCRLAITACHYHKAVADCVARQDYLRALMDRARGRELERLACYGLSCFGAMIDMQTVDATAPSFVDTLLETKSDARTLLIRACRAVTRTLCDLASSQPKPYRDVVPGEGQALLLTLRICDLLAMEVSLRKLVMRAVAPMAVRVLMQGVVQFSKTWLLGPLAVQYHKEDQFRAGYAEGWLTLKLVNLSLVAAQLIGQTSEPELADAYVFATERFALLFKLLGDLHYYSDETSDPDHKDYFFKCMVRAILDIEKNDAVTLNAIKANLAAMNGMAERIRHVPTTFELVISDDDLSAVKSLQRAFEKVRVTDMGKMTDLLSAEEKKRPDEAAAGGKEGAHVVVGLFEGEDVNENPAFYNRTRMAFTEEDADAVLQRGGGGGVMEERPERGRMVRDPTRIIEGGLGGSLDEEGVGGGDEMEDDEGELDEAAEAAVRGYDPMRAMMAFVAAQDGDAAATGSGGDGDGGEEEEEEMDGGGGGGEEMDGGEDDIDAEGEVGEDDDMMEAADLIIQLDQAGDEDEDV